MSCELFPGKVGAPNIVSRYHYYDMRREVTDCVVAVP